MANGKLLNEIVDEAAVIAQVNNVKNILYELYGMIKDAPVIYGNNKSTGGGIEAMKVQSEELLAVQAKMVAMQNQVNDANAKVVSMQQQMVSQSKANASAIASETKAIEDNITTRLKLQGRIAGLNKDMKEDLDLKREGIITEAEYKKRIVDTETSLVKYKAQLTDTNQVIKAQSKVVQTQITDYRSLSSAYTAAALNAKNLQIQAPDSEGTKQAIIDANLLGDKLKELDASVGQNQRSVGNYAGALTGYANTLRGLRGPTKLLAEAFGISAMEADQFRLVIEHSLQGMAAYFRNKENAAKAAKANATATAAETVVTTEATVATEAGVVAETELVVAKERGVLATIISGAWNKVLTFIYGEQAVAAATAAEATGALYTVMSGGILLVIGLFIAGIVKLVGVISDWIHADKIAIKNQLAMAEATSELSKAYDEQIDILERFVKTYKEKIKTELALNESAGASEDKLFAKKKALNDFEKNLMLDKRAIKIKEAEADRVQSGVKGEQALHDAELSHTVKYEGLAARILVQRQLLSKAVTDKKSEGKQDDIKEKIKDLETLAKFEKGIADSYIKLNEDTNAAKLDGDKLMVEHSKFTAEEQAKYNLQVIKEKAERTIQYNEIILNNETSTQKQLLSATKEISKQNINIIKAERDEKLTNPSLTPMAKGGIEKEASASIAKVTLDGQQKIDKIKADGHKRELEAQYGLSKNLLDERVRSNKEISANEALSMFERLQALVSESKAEQDLEKARFSLQMQNPRYQIKRDESGKIIELDQSTKNEMILAEKEHGDKINAIVEKSKKDATKIHEDASAKQIALAKELHDGLIKAQLDANSLDANARIRDEAKAYTELSSAYLNGAMSADKYAKAKEKLDNKTAIANINSEMTEQFNLMKVYDRGSKERFAAETKVSELMKKLGDVNIKISDKTDADKKKKVDEFVGYERKGAELVTSIVDGGFENKKNAIQKEMDLISTRQETDVAAINNSTLNAQQKAAELLIINQTAATQKQKLAREQKDEDIKKAKFDKEMAIFQAVINLAAVVIEQGVVTPQAIASEVLGLVEIGIIAAKPIPKYAVGTNFAEGGASIVGEIGPELRIDPSGKMSMTPGVPTLTNLERGTKIIPNNQLNDYFMQKSLMMDFNSPSQKENNIIDMQILQVMKDVKTAIKSQRRSSTTINIDRGWGDYINDKVRN